MFENALAPRVQKPEEKDAKAVVRDSEQRPRYYYCKTKRYANYMLMNGARMIAVQNDKYQPGRLVFVFLWDDACQRNHDRWNAGDRDTFNCPL